MDPQTNDKPSTITTAETPRKIIAGKPAPKDLFQEQIVGDKMLVLVQANVLTIGLKNRKQALRELPIRLISMQSGKQAARSLKSEKVDSVISSWQLQDSKDGAFLRKLRVARPEIPTIVLVQAGNTRQEAAARSLGVAAVLTDDTTDELFAKTVANVLGLKGKVSIKSISPAEKSRTTEKENASGVQSLRKR